MEKLEGKGLVFLRYESNEKKSGSLQIVTPHGFCIIKFCLFLFVLHYVPRFLMGYGHLGTLIESSSKSLCSYHVIYSFLCCS